MRFGPALLTLVLWLLAACQLSGPQGPNGPTGLAVDEIAVTSLESPSETDAGSAEADQPETMEAPLAETVEVAGDPPEEGAAETEAETPTETDAETPAEPEAPKSPQQVMCETAGGIWTVAGETGAFLCVSQTRDSGKSCRKKDDCEGQCLARSGTCAPYNPLFGCNEVLDKDGRRMTLCID